MRARHVFFDSLCLHGVNRIFGNPGTTESPLLDGLRDYPDLQYITALHEGVALTAASYYARASGVTGIVNVHVAPGLGNSLGSLYGALRARAPLILTAGQQDTRMRMREPVLGHDLVAMARPLVKWSAQVEHADEMGSVMARAFKIANEPPFGPVFVALPINVMEQETQQGAWSAGEVYGEPHPPAEGLAHLAHLLAAASRPALISGDEVATGGAVDALVQLAEATGAVVFREGLNAHQSFPNRHGNYGGAIGFEASTIRRNLQDCDVVLMIGGPFFEEIWHDEISAIPEPVKLLQITDSHDAMGRNFGVAAGVVGALAPAVSQLASLVRELQDADTTAAATARNSALAAASTQRRSSTDTYINSKGDAQPMSAARAMREIAAAMPEDGVVVEEAITAMNDVDFAFELNQHGDYFGARGGGIGQGIAGALGVKVAYPERPVLCITGDGSAMYHIQSLWTAARENLAIVFVVLNNREYRVLKHNLDVFRQRFDAESNEPYPHMNIGPELSFVDLAKGMGVECTQVSDPTELRGCAETAFASGKPHVIDVRVAGKESV